MSEESGDGAEAGSGDGGERRLVIHASNLKHNDTDNAESSNAAKTRDGKASAKVVHDINDLLWRL